MRRTALIAWRVRLAGALGLALAIVFTAPALADVDTALIVSVDVSSSVDAHRYRLQLEGIAAALEDETVIQTILNGPNQAILFTMLTWTDYPRTAIPWTRITSLESAKAIAAKVRMVQRKFGVFTCVANMFESIPRMVSRIPEPASRIVLDVSGDGTDNCNPGRPAGQVRDGLVDSGLIVNGLPIIEGVEAATIEQWYRENVQGGPGSFILPAYGYEEFGIAIRQKFLKEISASPSGTAAAAAHGDIKSRLPRGRI